MRLKDVLDSTVNMECRTRLFHLQFRLILERMAIAGRERPRPPSVDSLLAEFDNHIEEYNQLHSEKVEAGKEFNRLARHFGLPDTIEYASLHKVDRWQIIEWFYIVKDST